MSKIENSQHLDFINESIINNQLSLGQLVIELKKRGFSISKASLSNYAKTLKATYSTENDNITDEKLKELIEGDEIDYSKEYDSQTKILFEMYKSLIKRAYTITSKNQKVVPLSLFKSIKELQTILKNQKELSKSELDSFD